MFGKKSLGSGKNRRGQSQGPWWSQSKQLLITMFVLTGFIGLMVAGYLSQISYLLYKYAIEFRIQLDPSRKIANPIGLSDILSLKGLWLLNDLKYPTLLFWLLFVGIGVVIVWIRVFRSYITYNNYEYGNEGFEDNNKVEKQYPNIPDRDFEFDGYGGIPVLHKNKLSGKVMQYYTYVVMPLAKKPFVFWVLVPLLILALSAVTDLIILLITFIHSLFSGVEINFSISQLSLRIIFGATVLVYGICFFKACWSIFIDPEEKLSIFSRFKYLGKYMIDRATNNTLIYGITRSGKGTNFVFPTLDILSRAKKKVSIFINDPKGELARSSFFSLVKRGYKVVIIDLSNMYKSASYNPLQVIIDYAKKGYTDQVQMEVNKLSTSIYQTKEAGGNAKFWNNSSSNLLNALILAQIDMARRNGDWNKVTMFNIYQMLTQMAGKEVIVDSEENITDDIENGKKESMLTHYFNIMAKAPYDPFRQMALDAFSQSSFAGSETQGSIFSSMMEGIKLYQQQDVAKLTSKNTVDFKEAAFPRRFSVKLANNLSLETANVVLKNASNQVVETRNQDIDNLGYLNYAIKTKLFGKFSIDVKVEKDRGIYKYVFNGEVVDREKAIGNPLKKSSKSVTQTIRVLKDNEVFLNKKLSQNAVDNFSDVKLNYSEQPVAVFFVTPPNNDAYNQIVSFAIDQSFNQMYEMATQNGGKCYRRVHYLLDEFGNLPTVNSMDTKISIGLGQELLFDIVIQNDEQLSNKYDEKVANTIKANCSNTLYILSNDEKTTELVSKKLGKTTVMTRNHSITPDLSVGRDTITTNQTAQDVMSSVELQRLKVGEQVLLRANTRQSVKGNKIRNNPIFAHGLTYQMPAYWQFLQNTFDSNTRMSDIPYPCVHSKMDLKENAYVYFNNGENISDDNQLLQMMSEAKMFVPEEDAKKLNPYDKEQREAIESKSDEEEQGYLFTSGELNNKTLLKGKIDFIFDTISNLSDDKKDNDIIGFLKLSKTERKEFIEKNNNAEYWNKYGINRRVLGL